MSNYYSEHSVSNFGANHGQYQSTTGPSRSALWSAGTTRKPVSNVPENYYNYHNSLYESSTAHSSSSSDDEYYYDDSVINSGKNKKRPSAVQRPPPSVVADEVVDDEQYSNYEVMTHLGNEDTSVYPEYLDYADRNRKRKPSNKVYRKKIGMVEEDTSGDYYDYAEDPNVDQKIRNIRKNDAIFR